MKLINRLERKYQEKIRSRAEQKHDNFKNVLQNIRESQSSFEYSYLDYIDDVFNRGPKTA